MARELPTNLTLLRTIYDDYYAAFVDYSDDNKTRSSKIWVPIDLEALARRFATDPDLLFGRMYYHMNQKYGETQADGSRMDFFQPRVGRDEHCVNFPFLTSVLADLQEERKRFMVATGIAGLSLGVSVLSILIAVFA